MFAIHKGNLVVQRYESALLLVHYQKGKYKIGAMINGRVVPGAAGTASSAGGTRRPQLAHAVIHTAHSR